MNNPNSAKRSKSKKRRPATQITPKGIAILAAAESGLLPKMEDAWDLTNFEIFWAKFKRGLLKQGPEYLNDYIAMLYEKS